MIRREEGLHGVREYGVCALVNVYCLLVVLPTSGTADRTQKAENLS